MLKKYWFAANLFVLNLALLGTIADRIVPGEQVTDGKTITSAGEIFELGFFSFENSTNRYVGIWYYKIPAKTIVWVANRENPLTNSSGVLAVTDDGNLVVFDGNMTTTWSTNVPTTSKNRSAELLDNGNLVLREGNSGLVLWQSFDHPSNTLIPGMRIGLNLKTGESRTLRSWRSNSEPAPGIFSFGIDRQDANQLFILKGSTPHWRSGYYNNRTFNKLPDASDDFLFHFVTHRDKDGIYFEYSALYSTTRLVMDASGQIGCNVWYGVTNSWGVVWLKPRDICDIYATCGPYARCDDRKTPVCECMPGFKPSSPKEWSSGNWSSGCVRKEALSCRNGDRFLSMGLTKVPDGELSMEAESEKECKDRCVGMCNCTAYAYANMSDVVAPSCLVWHGRLIDAADFTSERRDEGVRNVYIRVAASELGPKVKPGIVALVVIIVVGALLLSTTIYCLMRKRKKRGNREIRTPISSGNLSPRVVSAKSFLYKHQFGEDGIENQEIPVFKFDNIASATSNFSNSNKLGKGGFGFVYKGTLQEGQEIAVKRLSSNSGQGFIEFRNEVRLIAKLQHRNLVRLLGYCIDGDELLLVYEYMPNKSLDFHLFDQNRCTLLNWERRFNIILGIARGLLYLHEDSRLRIIHRDLKASNILLDKDLNPKISDFGIARIFDNDQTQANTRRIFGTFGYMSPEYALKGQLSMKSDVFSFGVILLEIISGRKNSSFGNAEDSFCLLGHAWRLWTEGKGMDFADPLLIEPSNYQVLKCLHVGLLCVQEDPKSRPSMTSVVIFLNDSKGAPSPEQPPFIFGGTFSRRGHSCSSQSSYSTNDVTISSVDGR